jgi:hypothetical protein
VSLPSPEPGLVVHFEYLWAREAVRGREHGRYARPCLIVACTPKEQGGPKVLIVPITHSEPDEDTEAIEIPVATRQRLGLDGDRSWLILDEVNEFDWPGPDLQHNKEGEFHYGLIPPVLFDAATAGLLASARAGSLTKIPRREVKA